MPNLIIEKNALRSHQRYEKLRRQHPTDMSNKLSCHYRIKYDIFDCILCTTMFFTTMLQERDLCILIIHSFREKMEQKLKSETRIGGNRRDMPYHLDFVKREGEKYAWV